MKLTFQTRKFLGSDGASNHWTGRHSTVLKPTNSFAGPSVAMHLRSSKAAASSKAAPPRGSTSRWMASALPWPPQMRRGPTANYASPSRRSRRGIRRRFGAKQTVFLFIGSPRRFGWTCRERLLPSTSLTCATLISYAGCPGHWNAPAGVCVQLACSLASHALQQRWRHPKVTKGILTAQVRGKKADWSFRPNVCFVAPPPPTAKKMRLFRDGIRSIAQAKSCHGFVVERGGKMIGAKLRREKVPYILCSSGGNVQLRG